MLSRRAINPMAEDDALPPAAVREILLRLPADQRARAACVCRRWREVVADPGLWTVLDLTVEGGVSVDVTAERLLAAAARAQGRLEVLNVPDDSELFPSVLAVATANAPTLRELRTLSFDNYEWEDGQNDGILGVDDLQALLLAAPALQLLEGSVTCTLAVAHRLLRREPPFGPVRLWELDIDCKAASRDIASLAADLVTQPSLRSIGINGFENFSLTLDELDSVVNAALALRLDMLRLYDCELTPAAVPALCRVLSSTALTSLSVMQLHSWTWLLDETAAVGFAEALRANRTLTSLTLNNVLKNSRDKAVLLLSLVGHASLRTLRCTCELSANPVFIGEQGDPVLIGLSLGALIAANAPELAGLDVSMSHLGDAGLGPLCDALPRNTHLRWLSVRWNGMSAAFAAQRLLPAVRANESLRLLEADDVADEAVRLVNARRA